MADLTKSLERNSTTKTINDHQLHADKAFSSVLLTAFLVLLLLFFIYCLMKRNGWKCFLSKIITSSKNGCCSSVDEEKSILSKYRVFRNDINAEAKRGKVSFRKTRTLDAKLLLPEEKINEEEESDSFSGSRIISDLNATVFEAASCCSSLIADDVIATTTTTISATADYQPKIIIDPNGEHLQQNTTTMNNSRTLTPSNFDHLTSLSSNDNTNKATVMVSGQDRSHIKYKKCATAENLHNGTNTNNNNFTGMSAASSCTLISNADSLVTFPRQSPIRHLVTANQITADLELTLTGNQPKPPERNLNLPLSDHLAATNGWTDFRYGIKSPNLATGTNGIAEIESQRQKPDISTNSEMPEFKCIITGASQIKNRADSVEKSTPYPDSMIVQSSINKPSKSGSSFSNSAKIVPRSAPGSPNKRHEITETPIHRVNSSGVSLSSTTNTAFDNAQNSALLIFDDDSQSSNRRTSVSSTDSFLDDNLNKPLTRAVSTESVDSSFSITEYSHESEVGQLELRLLYDSATQFLFVWVLQICDLKYALGSPEAQVWVVLFLLPFPKPLWRTQLRKNCGALSFHEKFHQCVREQDLKRVALLCQLYGRKSNLSPAADLLGQVKVRLKDVQLMRINTVWLTVLPPTTISEYSSQYSNGDKKVAYSTNLGELLFSLNYQPAAERLTVVIARVKGLLQASTNGFTPKAVTVRVYLVQGAKVSRKKTSLKYISEASVIFNESMIFALPQTQISKVSLRLSIVAFNSKLGDHVTLGQVTVGPRRTGKEFGHWQRMIEQPRKPANMWHCLVPKYTTGR